MFDLFHYDFMIRAFIAGIVVACSAPLVGLFLVVRRYSYMADTLAHVSLVGVAIGLLTGGNPVITALVVSTASAWGIEHIRATKKFFGDSILSIFLSGSLALAILIIGLAKGFNQDLFSFLFGSITTVSTFEVYIVAILGVVIVAGVLLFYKELFLVALNEDLAAAEGLNVKWLNLFLVITAALSISLAMRIVGSLLIGALMVIPVTTALQFGRSFRDTIWISLVFSLFSTIAGLFASFYLDLPSGATIVVVALLCLIAGFLFNKK